MEKKREAPGNRKVQEAEKPGANTMTSKAHPSSPSDPFSAARVKFETMVDWLASNDAPQTEAELEKAIGEHGTELLRLLLQAQFDLLFERERANLAVSRPVRGTTVRVRVRHLETEFGRVVNRRHGITELGAHAAQFSLDEQLNLPPDLYSYPLRERVADEARRGAWDQVIEQVNSHTAGHVPKRQAEQVAVEATQDFEAFYEQRPPPANDTLSSRALLVASCDSKGIRMRPEALREATRKAAEEEQAEAVRGDPMAAKKLRLHDRRMALVTAVWEQEPHRRSARDILDNLRPASDVKARRRKKARRARAPSPFGKRLVASVEKNQTEGIAEMFDELDRRDPERTRKAIVLIDGEAHQIGAIVTEEGNRGRELTLVIDIIHVLSYLWGAGFALCAKNTKKTEVWVTRFLGKLLTQPVESVTADIQRSLAQRRIPVAARKPIDDCVRYFTANAHWMRYAEFLAAGLPIATGVIEGACRHLIQDRLGITGARWGVAGAEAILKLRALHTNGDWDDYWRFHQQREAARNYAWAA
jgi:hypothetical protein